MIFSYLLTLFGVCGLAVGSLVVLRAMKGGTLSLGAAQPIRIVGRQTLGAGSTLLLVEVEAQKMLIGVSRSGIVLIEAKPAPVSNIVPINDGFHAVLKRAGERW